MRSWASGEGDRLGEAQGQVGAVRHGGWQPLGRAEDLAETEMTIKDCTAVFNSTPGRQASIFPQEIEPMHRGANDQRLEQEGKTSRVDRQGYS